MPSGRQRKPLYTSGTVFGRLTIVVAGERIRGRQYYSCECMCGNVVTAEGANLLRGNTQSCGCLQKERAEFAKTTHGGSYTAEYWCYQNAKKRCNNPKATFYENYGGRGIEFRFASFEEFFAELGPRPSQAHTIDVSTTISITSREMFVGLPGLNKQIIAAFAETANCSQQQRRSN